MITHKIISDLPESIVLSAVGYETDNDNETDNLSESL